MYQEKNFAGQPGGIMSLQSCIAPDNVALDIVSLDI
jgi:hypothetical protein